MAEQTVYYMCKYTPLELLAGFGVRTERLEPAADSFDLAESVGHANLCGYGKGLLEAALQRGVQELVLVNCCDVVRRVYDILKRQGQMAFLYLLDLPHNAGETQIRLLAAQLEKLREAYARYSGLGFDEQRFLEACGSGGCGCCGDTTSEGMRRNTQEQVAREQETYISLQGAHSGAFLTEQIRKHFPVPVRDDTCTGNRMLAPLPAGTECSMYRYAQILLTQLPCMRMTDASARGGLGAHAAGVIYHTMKFCDYYGFEYAALSGKTEAPLLKIETDGTRQSEGQLSTRLDAFAESLHMENRQNEPAAAGTGGTCTAGVDSGSASTDAVILDAEGKLAGWSVVRTGAGAASGAQKALAEAMQMAGITASDLRCVVSTGYGRETIGMGDASVTEITCHAKGAHWLMPSVRTVIDIGGQDSKIIRVDENGGVVNFVMNDKCAAGTGRFLEMMARTMEMSLEDMSTRGLHWKNEVRISSMCTVFAESEVVSLIAANTAPEDIIHGLNQSVASRTAALLARVGEMGDYMMTGGVARNRSLVEVLEKRLGQKIHVSEHAQLCGAIGAALIARARAEV